MEVLVNKDDENEATHQKRNNYKLLFDSESSDEEVEKAEPILEKPNKKNTILSSDSGESDLESDENETTQNNEVEEKQVKDRRKNANPKKKIIAPKIQRKSAAKALNVIKEKMSHSKQAELKQKIQSEKQRMIREEEIRVPYHKPKQMSLKEFLARKTINRPPTMEQIKRGNYEGVSTIIAMKKVSENIEQFAQKMKEREEEAIEFFKSESESDSEELEGNENKENLDANPLNESEPSISAPVDPTVGQTDECERDQDETSFQPDKEILKPSETSLQVDAINEEPMNQEEKVEPQDDINISFEKDQKETVSENIENPSEDDKNAELDRLRLKYKDASSTIEPNNEPFPEKSIDVKPKFSLKTLDEMASNDCCIDLETGKIEPRKLTGPEMLFQRYMQTIQKPKQKDSVELNILSVENGKLENQVIEVKLNNEVELDHNRPGYSHELLKQKLRDQIVNKRIGEMKLKIKAEDDMKELEPEDKPDCSDDKEAEEEDADDEETDEEIYEEEEEEEEGGESKDRKKKSKGASCGFLDEEAVDEDGSEDEDESDEDSSEEETDEVPTAANKKGRIIRAFVDSDDEESDKPLNTKKVVELEETIAEVESQTKNNEIPEDDMFSTPKDSEDLFSTQPSDFTFTEPSVSEEMKTQGIRAICDKDESQTFEDDFLEICSGQFEPTQDNILNFIKPPIASNEVSEESQFISQVAQPSEVESLIVPVDTTPTQLKNNRPFLESSDDEVVDALVDKKLKKKKKRKKPTKKLGFSDDEDESEDAEEEEKHSENEEEKDEEELEECEEEEKYVEPLYDSEENEIEEEDVENEIQRKERVKAAGKFFEDEAELTESEWGSADEDEKDLDKFDIELGDEDQFDQNQLQEEVGRIHARKLLDDDIRNVKKIEQLLFEDEEIDGVGRERKFRWKNQDKSFPLQDENACDGDQLEEDDFEEEVAWRKMRHERETMLSEQSLNLTESDKLSEEIILLDHNSQVTSSSNCSFSKRKFNVIKTPVGLLSTSSDAKKESPFLIKATSLKKYQHSSFLSRDDETLSKIARFVSHKSVNDEVSNMSSNTSNSMSFMTVDKPDESKKRKSFGRTDQEPSKKRKIEGKNLLDQLK